MISPGYSNGRYTGGAGLLNITQSVGDHNQIGGFSMVLSYDLEQFAGFAGMSILAQDIMETVFDAVMAKKGADG